MKTNSTALGARMLALAGLTGVLAAPVWAQGTSSQGSGAQSSATAPPQSSELQEGVVTAEGGGVDIQQTPIAVTAIQGAQLEELHLNTISDLQTTVPAFQSNELPG